jgi:hypothetical protein
MVRCRQLSDWGCHSRHADNPAIQGLKEGAVAEAKKQGVQLLITAPSIQPKVP